MTVSRPSARPTPFSATVLPDVRDAALVEVVGDLDLESRDLLEAAVVACLHQKPRTVSLDLHRVTFMDCAGTTGLLACHSRAVAQEARLVVVDPSTAVTRILPRDVAAALGIRAWPADLDPGVGPRRRLECVPCGQVTPHVLGEQTIGTDGTLLVQWWRCTECEEGNTIA